jgi:hypothetical protein
MTPQAALSDSARRMSRAKRSGLMVTRRTSKFASRPPHIALEDFTRTVLGAHSAAGQAFPAKRFQNG